MAVYSFNATNKCVYLFVLTGTVVIDGEIVDKRDGTGIWGNRFF